jgi:hypothetical protein
MSSRYARLDVREINTAIDIQLQQSSQEIPAPTREQIIENMWQQWIDWEVRQRLRAACLAFDIFQSITYGQERCQPAVTTENTYFALPCSESLWNATSSQVWFSLIRSSKCATVRFCHPETLTYDTFIQLPLSTQCLALTSLIATLPAWDRNRVPSRNPNFQLCLGRINSLFGSFIPASAHLALYHTPLKQLLAWTGESWVFGKKIASHSDFEAIKPIVRSWIGSHFGELATWYACNFLRFCFAENYGSRTFYVIGDYWAIYTCTLIIWTFGQRPSTALPSSGNTSAAISRRTSFSTLSCSEGATEVLNRASLWTTQMASHNPDQLINLHIRMDTAVVLEAAWVRLMYERPVGCQPPALLLDACNVLEKLHEQGPKLF